MNSEVKSMLIGTLIACLIMGIAFIGVWSV
jgi:hypothetical protein